MAYWWENVQIKGLAQEEIKKHISNRWALDKDDQLQSEEKRKYSSLKIQHDATQRTLQLAFDGSFKQYLEQFKSEPIPLPIVKQVLDYIDPNNGELFHKVVNTEDTPEAMQYRVAHPDEFINVSHTDCKVMLRGERAIFFNPTEPPQRTNCHETQEANDLAREQYMEELRTHYQYCKADVERAEFIAWAANNRDRLADQGYKIEDDRSELQRLLAQQQSPVSETAAHPEERLPAYGLIGLVEDAWRRGMSVKETVTYLKNEVRLSHAQIGALLSFRLRGQSEDGSNYRDHGKSLWFDEVTNRAKWRWPTPPPNQSQSTSEQEPETDTLTNPDAQ